MAERVAAYAPPASRAAAAPAAGPAGREAAAGVNGIGARIRSARLARGLSQGDLEQRTGLLRCYLSRVENGHTAPSLQTLARLATALGMTVAALFEEAPGPADDFLSQMRHWAQRLSAAERQQVLALAEQMAARAAGAAGSR